MGHRSSRRRPELLLPQKHNSLPRRGSPFAHPRHATVDLRAQAQPRIVVAAPFGAGTTRTGPSIAQFYFERCGYGSTRPIYRWIQDVRLDREKSAHGFHLTLARVSDIRTYRDDRSQRSGLADGRNLHPLATDQALYDVLRSSP